MFIKLRLFFFLYGILCWANWMPLNGYVYYGLPLYYWHERFVNFGDYLSLKLVERIVGCVNAYEQKKIFKGPRFLAIGSILSFARDGDVVWGAGVNGKLLDVKHYKFKRLEVRAVRGPLTREFLMKHFNIACPEIYGDPALLVPYLFPEFKRKEQPAYEYIIIPHYSECHLFPQSKYPQVVYPTEEWHVIIQKILDSRFVIASSLHGIIIAEAYGIPARMLRVSEKEPLFKYQDYYLGTGRPHFKYACSIQEALDLGGERPVECDLYALYKAFPFDYWPQVTFKF